MNKHIERQRGERGYEYDASLDGVYIGTFRNEREAQAELDRLAYEALTHRTAGETPPNEPTLEPTPTIVELDDLEIEFPSLAPAIGRARQRLLEGGVRCWWDGDVVCVQQGDKSIHRATEDSQLCTCAASVTCWARPLAIVWRRKQIPTMRERRERAPLMHPRRGHFDDNLFKEE